MLRIVIDYTKANAFLHTWIITRHLRVILTRPNALIGRSANIFLIISSLKNLFETMINDYNWLKLVLNLDKRWGTIKNGQERSGTVRDVEGRSGTVRNDQERSGTVRDVEGLWFHDGGRSVTMGHDDLKMVTGR